SPIFYITVGTGVGGGLIIDGQIYRGCGRGAAEIGHLRPIYPPNHHWPNETVEGWVSGPGIVSGVSRAERLGFEAVVIHRYAASGPITVKAVVASARDGDAFARGVLDEAVQALAEGICSVIALLCPRRVVIGGGVSLIGDDLFFDPL